MYPPVKNAIVLMFDSLQYNYLGCNGNTWIKTPNFDRFARESMVFDNCYIEGLPTVPCRRAMHTGRFTLPVKGWSPLDMDDTTIADLCWGTNIDTALIFDTPPYRLPKFNYTRSFDKVWFIHGGEGDHMFYGRDALIHHKPEDFHTDQSLKAVVKSLGEGARRGLLHETESYLKFRQYWKTDADQNVAVVMKKSIEYLEQLDRNKPFHLWVDSFDPHEPWDSPSVYDPNMKCPYDPDYKGKEIFLPAVGDTADGSLYTEEELHHIRMLYAEKVTLCDKWLGWFIDNVKRLGLEEDTLIMLVSDHGEPMGNGEHGHGIMRKCRPWPYEELVHGVMMLKGPGIKPNQRSKAFVQSCDVAPTVCDFLGLGVRDFHQGKNLLPMARGEMQKVRDFAIAGYYKYSWSIITDDWSYIHWLKKEQESLLEALFELYARGSLKHVVPPTQGAPLRSEELRNETMSEYKEAASLDGEDQWTCTPSSLAELPARDELYDRKKDPFQLHNIIDQYQDEAKELYYKLRAFMGEVITN
jgi:arylsulfatase A-like enzyme